MPADDRPAYAVAPDVAHHGVGDPAGPDEGRTVYVAHVPEGPLVVLEGTAAVIWDAATTAARRAWLGEVAERLGGRPDEVAETVQAFADELVAQGYLEPTTD